MNCIKKIAYVCVLLLMTTGTAWGMDIFQAARTGNIGRIEELLANGADVNQSDKRGMTPLHWAARYGHEVVVLRLIGAGADINQQDHEHWMPWHLAMIFGHKTIASRFEEAIASRLIETNRRSDSAYYGKGAPYINYYIKRIDQAHQRVPVIAHTLALATNERLGATSPLALLSQELMRHITHLVAEAEEVDARRPRQADGAAL